MMISNRPEETIEQCRLFRPYVLLMEVTGYTPWNLEERMKIRDNIKQRDSSCNIVIMVDENADMELANSVKMEKRMAELTHLFLNRYPVNISWP